jgi:hypothetical protein
MSVESQQAGHTAAARQLEALLARLSRTTLQARVRVICESLVHYEITKSRMPRGPELHWTIRHLMMVRCRGVFDPVEIEEWMELAERLWRRLDPDPLQRIRILARV